MFVTFGRATVGMTAALVSAAGLAAHRDAQVDAERVRFSAVAVAGDRVLVAGTLASGPAVLRSYRLDGLSSSIAVPDPSMLIDDLDASWAGLTFSTGPRGSGRRQAYFSRWGGRLRRFDRGWVDTAVTRTDAVALLENIRTEQGALLIRPLREGPSRRVQLPGRGFGDLKVAGRYASVWANFASVSDERIVVMNLRTGRLVYRVRVPGAEQYALDEHGRIVTTVASGRRWRIITATPMRPRPRTVTTWALQTPDIRIADGQIALLRGSPDQPAEITLLEADGRHRSVGQGPRHVVSFAFDGRRLAVADQHCLFAGPVSAAPQPLNGCPAGAQSAFHEGLLR